MDGNGFDEFTRRLAAGRSRRSVLRGIAGAGAALVAARAGTSLTEAATKVTICHWSEDVGAYEQISVSQSAVSAHQAHQGGQDIIDPDFSSAQTCGDCNTACDAADACTPAACVGGACDQASACTGYQTCGGGGVAGECGCAPTFTTESCDGVTCGDVPDGCGSTVPCGCAEGETCGGGGIAGECGCTPTFTVADCDGVTCGEIADGCGSTVTCGCADGETCGANGCEAIETACANVQLAGYPTNSEPYGVCVDDYLDIYVNGEYKTTVTGGGCKPAVSLGPLQTGDVIYLELGDYLPPCTIEPFQLICGDTGAVLQELNPTGSYFGGNYSDDWSGFGICYNAAFIVSFEE